jgi:hypothetical protein
MNQEQDPNANNPNRHRHTMMKMLKVLLVILILILIFLLISEYMGGKHGMGHSMARHFSSKKVLDINMESPSEIILTAIKKVDGNFNYY